VFPIWDISEVLRENLQKYQGVPSIFHEFEFLDILEKSTEGIVEAVPRPQRWRCSLGLNV